MDDIDLKEAYAVLNQYGIRIQKAISKNLQQHNVSAAGGLADSFSFEITVEEGDISWKLIANDIHGKPNYWQYVNYGRGPGRNPPYQHILSWVQARASQGRFHTSIQDRLTTRGKGRNKAVSKSVTALHNDKIEQFAWAVTVKIGKEGTAGSYFLTGIFAPGGAGDKQVLEKELSLALKTDIITNLVFNNGSPHYNK